MEVSEINKDMMERESNVELINQREDSGTLNESALQNEEQMDVESRYQAEEGKLKSDGNSAADDLEKHNEDSDTSLLNTSSENVSSEILIVKGEIEEPLKKKLKLGAGERVVSSVLEELQSGQDTENHSEDSQHFEESESQGIMDGKKEEEKIERRGRGKSAGGPETDMLVTLASAALEQNPKDKTDQGTAESGAVKQESEVPEKKPDLWCNVGVFDTNSAVVSEYIATPEPNEQVDLVTANLAGCKIQLEPGAVYKFRVCAVNACGRSPWSEVAAFKTTLPGFPGAPSAIKISKSPEGALLTWEPPAGGSSNEIVEYAVYLAVRSASQSSQPGTTNQGQLAFVRVFCGPTNKCIVSTNTLQAAHIDTTTKPAIIFRIAAKNSKGYGPATQVRWLQESQNGAAPRPKKATKS